jgi:hypothetical protein
VFSPIFATLDFSKLAIKRCSKVRQNIREKQLPSFNAQLPQQFTAEMPRFLADLRYRLDVL